MAKHNETGIKGEQIAEKFLQKKQYTILHRNWCCGKKEVDIIAIKQDVVVFIEVKTRSTHAFGYPEDSVTHQKQEFLKSAAALFLEEYPDHLKIQFDIISILMENDAVKELHHFEDAFY